jgi:hypothetical protein
MKQLSLVVLGFFIVLGSIAHAESPPKFSGMSYLDNGTIRIGVNLEIGGAITYLSKSGSDENMINSHDWGRQIQMSFYSGPVPYEPNDKKPRDAWTFIGWNPIQSGDTFNNPATVIAHTNSGTELYVKCIPMHWPLDNEPGHCTFETWLTLKDNTVQVRSQINNAREDKTQYRARGQELPAVYTNGGYYRLFTYDGDKPFTKGPLRVIDKVWDTRTPPAEVVGGPWDHWYCTENWAALVNDDDFGVGIWTPGTYDYKGGFAGKPGSGGPNDGPTGYISPIRREILDHNIQYDYTYTLIVGKVEEIRDYVYANAIRFDLPEYTFEADRQSWVLSDAQDEGWPITGQWNVKLTGDKPRLVGPRAFWKAADMSKLYLRAAFDTGANTAIVRWEGLHGQGGGQTEIAVNPDGTMRTLVIDMQALKNYTGICTRLEIIPKTDGHPNRTMTVDWVSHRDIGAN